LEVIFYTVKLTKISNKNYSDERQSVWIRYSTYHFITWLMIGTLAICIESLANKFLAPLRGLLVFSTEHFELLIFIYLFFSAFYYEVILFL